MGTSGKEKKGKISSSDRWQIIFSGALLLVCFIWLGLFVFENAQTSSQGMHSFPISLRSILTPDYNQDAQAYSFSAVDMGLIQSALQDQGITGAGNQPFTKTPSLTPKASLVYYGTLAWTPTASQTLSLLLTSTEITSNPYSSLTPTPSATNPALATVPNGATVAPSRTSSLVNTKVSNATSTPTKAANTVAPTSVPVKTSTPVPPTNTRAPTSYPAPPSKSKTPSYP